MLCPGEWVPKDTQTWEGGSWVAQLKNLSCPMPVQWFLVKRVLWHQSPFHCFRVPSWSLLPAEDQAFSSLNTHSCDLACYWLVGCRYKLTGVVVEQTVLKLVSLVETQSLNNFFFFVLCCMSFFYVCVLLVRSVKYVISRLSHTTSTQQHADTHHITYNTQHDNTTHFRRHAHTHRTRFLSRVCLCDS